MARREKIQPNGRSRSFPDDETIVSKTDLQGRILYANTTFLDVSAYTEDELIGQPQNIIRHPDMPAGLFKILWDELQAGREVFSYINNLAQDGVNYWVFAHVTQSHDAAGKHIGYHSTRRTVPLSTLAVIEPIYHRIRAVERRAGRGPAAAAAGEAEVARIMDEMGCTVNEWVWSLALDVPVESFRDFRDHQEVAA